MIRQRATQVVPLNHLNLMAHSLFFLKFFEFLSARSFTYLLHFKILSDILKSNLFLTQVLVFLTSATVKPKIHLTYLKEE
ncbi:MAG: hypothetical protein K0Q74_1507 [Gammaproteobacteria bacterium]|nr:hypothetical protein [Gammaproteobacteria bacterium]